MSTNEKEILKSIKNEFASHKKRMIPVNKKSNFSIDIDDIMNKLEDSENPDDWKNKELYILLYKIIYIYIYALL